MRVQNNAEGCNLFKGVRTSLRGGVHTVHSNCINYVQIALIMVQDFLTSGTVYRYENFCKVMLKRLYY